MSNAETEFVFAAPPTPGVRVADGGRFPVRRIFCIGKNYADHVKEMGGDAKTDAPVFFSKPADAVDGSGAVIPYPPATEDLHFEGELVLALGGAGRNLDDRAAAEALIFGFACGCDLTRRDLQAAAKKAGGPWDAAKGFDRSAPVGPIMRRDAAPADLFEGARLTTQVNGAVRQAAPLSAMIWSAPEIICSLSRFYELRPGDLVFTGTPSGVGPLHPGDTVRVAIGALPALDFTMGTPI